jgi:glycine cleavage system H protein
MPDLSSLLFSEHHQWIRIDGSEGVVGITDFAQSQMGDVVAVDMPRVGTRVTQFDEIGIVESTKVSSDIYTPLSGVVTALNDSLDANPMNVNDDPYGTGWLFRLELSDPNETSALMNHEQYAASVDGPTGAS